ncbi:hypothetical protein L873DRAFT_1667159 [Choiromyces venosus 120613-1]|uniref:SAP domain-containing protein n=1 Tax=Choiromyces venosus 120613-1 TaxID=1336337 RepID=A0A3N4K1Y2_9PEZI|nr:hypothetical protein L873DRAFT_1667159 [Choiromyces venosus 120613-1]
MPPKLKDLQEQCKAARLDHRGKIPELVQCLKDRKDRKESSPEDQEDPKCDAILVTQSKVSSEEETKRDAKDAFGQALEEEEIEVKMVMGELYVGNPRGLGLAGVQERLRVLEEKDILKDTNIASLKGKVDSLENNVTELNNRVSTLTLAGQDYRRVWNRFISTFKRDKLDDVTQSDLDIIRESSITVHGGDAAVDALLYEGVEGRYDTYTFEELYGMHPADVKKIMHKETIDILNLHAGVRADNDITGTDEFYKRFAEFIQAFKRSDPKVNYLIGESTNVTRAAYWSLLKCQRYTDSA